MCSPVSRLCLVLRSLTCLPGGRGTRESTPCSLIRDPETIRTPGSTTRHASSAETSRRMQDSMRRHIPTANEMDEFFAGAEEEQQRQFIEKYMSHILFIFASLLNCFLLFGLSCLNSFKYRLESH